MHPSSLQSCENFVKKYLNPEHKLNIADIGSYDVNGTYRKAVNEPNWRYTGIDIRPGPNVDIVVQEEDFFTPVFNHMTGCGDHYRYDVIISGSTLEHVRKPWGWIREVNSILKPGGLCFINVPNTWGQHDYPSDYWRVWPEGLKVLFDEVGWETLEVFTWGEQGYDSVGIARKPE